MAATTTQLPPPTTQPSPTLHDLHGTMTATQDQLALTKASRAGAVSTSTRQAVPAFLNKLYNMVSNPDTDELVRWSDEGDSFYIPSHERLSKELLPRFFKHGNFSSFVRQLNMYGFHKVPHLQQGVLQNSTESELWQFQNPHFQRGQPDLLCLITRKKTGGNADNAPDDTQHSNHAIASNGSAHSSGPSSGPLDMTVLTSSLSAIKKHQTSLSTELKTLQESNQHLWNEALAARDRHKKHQDTINKILKFLASVFGNGATGSPAAGPGASSPGARDGRASPGALVPRKRPRLMIEDGSASRDHESDDEEFVHFSLPVDHEMSEARISEAPSEGAPSPASVPAPVPDSRPANPLAKSESPPTPALATPLISQTAPPFPAAPPMNSIARRSSSQSTVPTTSTPSNPPEPHPTPQEFNPEDPQAQDHLYQETISKLLSSPSTLQRILATLSAAGPDAAPYQSELAPYYGGLMNGGMMNAPAGGMMNLPAAEGDLDPAIAYNAARLDQATDAVGAEVESVSQDINTLMREWGISPDMLQDHNTNGFGDFTAGANPNGYVPPPGTDASNFTQPYASIAPSNDAHVDIDTFLNQFEFPDDPSTDDPASFPVTLPAQFDLENPGPQSAAFLDEVHPVPSAASDTSLSPAIPLLDDFGVGSGVGIGPPSPNAQKFATPTAPVPNGAPPKRGKKRRSVETASLQEHVRPTRR